ncbi:MAG: serine/threonine protein kinase [Ignavibacteriaceae bacterium]|nr:serine/threonine protein kinase [Ignavibacteriaceae bacterium]
MNHISTELMFEKFEIINCLKKDGQAAVYLANHIFLSKKIILKTLNTDGLSDKTILERFKREAKILAQLDHPNIIKVLDFGMYSNYFYISFEYFESRNLREVINSNNLSVDDKISLITQLLKALSTAHQNEIIHRDIKPENILVNSELVLKIADFGLALVINDNNITQTSTVVGTPSYMSPEQIRGERTHQTDIFSTGLVCYELFTGINPVLGKDVGATINNILNFNFETIAQNTEKLPHQVKQALESMLKNNLADRAKSAAEVLKYFGVKEEQNNLHQKPGKIKLAYSYAIIILIIAAILGTIYLKYFNTSYTKAKSTLAVVKSPVSNSQVNTIPASSPGEIAKVTPLPSNEKKETAIKAEKPAVNAPDNDSKENMPGKVSIDCYPWAEVFIDNKKIDITPLNDYSLAPGKHKVELYQPEFPAYRKIISIHSGKTEAIKINFEDIVGYLNCEVYPWGEVYIDEKPIGTTPFNKPVALMPGSYKLTVKNANYAPVSKLITIKVKQKFNFSLNFQEIKQ